MKLNNVSELARRSFWETKDGKATQEYETPVCDFVHLGYQTPTNWSRSTTTEVDAGFSLPSPSP